MSAIEELGAAARPAGAALRDADDTIATARAAAAAGCRVVEVTMSTPGVEDAIAPLVADGLVVAVGTVRDARDVPRLADAGASLVVSFWNPPGFVAAAADAAGSPRSPAASPPTSSPPPTRTARRSPSSSPPRSPGRATCRRSARCCPTCSCSSPAGSTPDGVAPWLEAGALAVGLGSKLGTAATVGAAEVERRCRAALAAA